MLSGIMTQIRPLQVQHFLPIFPIVIYVQHQTPECLCSSNFMLMVHVVQFQHAFLKPSVNQQVNKMTRKSYSVNFECHTSILSRSLRVNLVISILLPGSSFPARSHVINGHSFIYSQYNIDPKTLSVLCASLEQVLRMWFVIIQS